MNLIVFTRNELLSNSLLRLSGERAAHLRDVLKVQPGSLLKVGERDGCLGKGVVTEVGRDEVALEVSLSPDLPEAPWIDVVLGMPRPIILKRVLQALASMGAREITLIGSARVEKSYFNSPILNDDKIEQFLQLGLEQSGTTAMPRVIIEPKFSSYTEKMKLGQLTAGQRRLIAHPGAERHLAELSFAERDEASVPLVAIGPEGGWIPREMERFSAMEFEPFCIGERILRVDTAVPAILGQLELAMKLQRQVKSV